MLKHGDRGLHYFDQFKDGTIKEVKDFDYAKYFNRLGFYKTDLNAAESPTHDLSKWGIEEVHDLTASIDQWQIVEEETSEPVAAAQNFDQEASVLLTPAFRDALSSEIEEVATD